MTDMNSNMCVWCGEAKAVEDAHGDIVWVTHMGTPICEHETIEGRK